MMAFAPARFLAALSVLFLVAPFLGTLAAFNETQVLVPSIGGAGQSGSAVAYSSDGSIALVGAPGVGAGSVFVLARQPNGLYVQTQVLTGSTATAGANFGYALAITSNALHAVIGALSMSSATGRSFVFSRPSTAANFTETQVLSGSVAINANAEFGRSVAITPDALTIFVGAMGAVINQGRAFLFTRPSTAANFTESQILVASTVTGNMQYGWSVAITPNALAAVVGSPGAVGNQGRAFVYTRTSTANNFAELQVLSGSTVTGSAQFGRTVVIASNTLSIIVGCAGLAAAQGRAYVYSRPATNTTFSETQILSGSGTGNTAQFGYFMSMTPDALNTVIGAIGSSSDTGKAYVFSRSSTTANFIEAQVLSGSTTAANSQFGLAVAISDDAQRVLVGAPGVSSFEGRAYAYVAVASPGSFALSGNSTITLSGSQFSVSGANTQAPTASTDLNVDLAGQEVTIVASPPGASYPNQLIITSSSPNGRVVFTNSVSFAGGISVAAGTTNTVAVQVAPGATVNVTGSISLNPATLTSVASSSIVASNGFSISSTTGSNSIAGSISAGTGSLTISSPTNTVNGSVALTAAGAVALTGTTGGNTITGTVTIASSANGVTISSTSGSNTITSATISAATTLSLSSQSNAINGGSMTAAGALTVSATAGSNTIGGTPTIASSANSVTLTANSGSNTISSGTVRAATTLTLTSQSNAVSGSAALTATNALSISATTGSNTIDGTATITSSSNSVTISSTSGSTTVSSGTVTAGTTLSISSQSNTVSGGALTATGAVTLTATGGGNTISGTSTITSSSSSISITGTGALSFSSGTLTAATSIAVNGGAASTLGADAKFVAQDVRIGPAAPFGSTVFAIGRTTFQLLASTITFNGPTTFNGLLIITPDWTVDISASGVVPGPQSAFTLTSASRTIDSNLLPSGVGSACVWVTSTTAPNFLVSLPNDIAFRNYVTTSPRALTVTSTNGGSVTRCAPLITSTLDRRNDVRQNDLVYYGGNVVYYFTTSDVLPFSSTITATDFQVTGGSISSIVPIAGSSPQAFSITVAITCDGLVQVNYLGSVTHPSGTYQGIVTPNSGSIVSAKCIAEIYNRCA